MADVGMTRPVQRARWERNRVQAEAGVEVEVAVMNLWQKTVLAANAVNVVCADKRAGGIAATHSLRSYTTPSHAR
jgi:hypothetical protein